MKYDLGRPVLPVYDAEHGQRTFSQLFRLRLWYAVGHVYTRFFVHMMVDFRVSASLYDHVIRRDHEI